MDPCQDFYQFACGGWIQQSFKNTDRFSAIDRRNQNVIASALKTNSESIYNVTDESAETKAKRFYQSCLQNNEEQDKTNLLDLQSVVDFTGGWNLTGSWNGSIGFQDKVERIQNNIGLSVLFTWGLIEYDNKYRLAIIAGGWNDALVVEDSEKEEYQKVMSMYTILLAQALEDTIELNVEPLLEDKKDANDSISIVLEYEEENSGETYEYEYDFNNISDSNFNGNKSELDFNKIMYALNPFNWVSDYTEKQGSNDNNETEEAFDEDVDELTIETINNAQLVEQELDYQADDGKRKSQARFVINFFY